MERFFKRPWLIVGIVAAITIFFALQMQRVELDNNNYRFVPETDPARVTSEHIDEIFGNQTLLIIGLERRRDTILDAEFIRKIRDYGDKLERLPVVDKVTSLVTADYIGGTADAITVEPLVPDDFSGTPAEIVTIRSRLLEWDIYRKALVSDDFKSTQILIKLNVKAKDVGQNQVLETYRAAKRIASAEGFADTKIYITGMPVFSGDINEAMKKDLRTLIPLVFIVVFFILFLSFRRLSGILLPLLTVSISVTWAVGAMPLFGVKMNIISTVLPVILVAVASAYCLHVISHYYDEAAGKRNLSEEEHRQLVFMVLRKYGKPIFLAAFTDATGFAALSFTPVLPIYEFGIFSTFGILVAFCIALTLIPALLLIHGPSRVASASATPNGAEEGNSPDALSDAIAASFCSIARKPRFVLVLSGIIIVCAIVGVSHLVIDNVLVEYFKGDAEVVKSDSFIRKYFGGSKTLSIVATGERPGDVLAPEVLSAMDGLASYLSKEVPEVGKVSGFNALVKRVNQVFNADESPDGIAPAQEMATAPTTTSGAEPGFGFDALVEPSEPTPPVRPTTADHKALSSKAIDQIMMISLLSEAVAESGKRDLNAEELVAALKHAANYQGAAYYEIPADPARYGKKDSAELKALISNYLVLLTKDILEDVADDPLEPKSIKLNVQLKTVGQIDTDRAVASINSYVASHFPKGVKVEVGGSALVEGALSKLVVKSQLTSLPISLGLVFITLTLFYHSGFAGLVGCIPLCISILVNFGIMGAFGIKLNIGTAMIASVAIGIGIDYTIHYLAAYHREYLARAEGTDFLKRTFQTAGKAIVLNAVSVGAGFMVLVLSQFNLLTDFGGLIAITMGTSAIVALTVLPVILERFRPAFITRPLPSERKRLDKEESK